MATVVKAANAETTVTTGWTNASNAFATSPDGSFATAVTSKNATTNGDYGFPDFTSSDIPDGSTINSVTLKFNAGMSATVTGGTVGGQLRNNGTNLGSETTGTATAQTEYTQLVTTGISLADLRSASTLIKARMRTSKGNSSTAMNGQLDYVSLTVNFSPPLQKVNIRQASIRASQTQRNARRLGAVAIVGLFTPWVSATVNKPIPFGISASATGAPATATVNQPIPIGRSIAASGGGAGPSGSTGGLVITLHRKPLPRRGGGVSTLGLTFPPSAIAATLAKAIPIGRSISASAIDSVLPGIGSLIIQRIPRETHRVRHRTTYLKNPPPPLTGRTATLIAPIIIGRSASAKVQVDGAVARAIPFGRSASATVRVDATVAKAIPIGRSIQVAVPSGATLNRAIPIGRSISVTNRVDGTLSRAIPFGRSITANATTTGLITLARAIPVGRSVSATVRVDATLSKPIPIGKSIRASNVVGATLISQAIPIGRSIAATALGSGQLLLSKPIPIGRAIATQVRVDATLAKPLPIGRFINIVTPPNAPPPTGEPTSAVVTDNGLRSALVTDAGVRSVIVTDTGHRSAIVNTT